MPGRKDCPKCKGEGKYKTKDGTMTTCFDCLQAGAMDQHGDKVKEAKDFNIRL